MNMSVLSASCRDPDSFEAVAGGIDKPLPFDCGATLVAGVTGEPCPFSCGVIGLNIALIKRLASPFATLSARAREREDFNKQSSICTCLLNFTTTVIQKRCSAVIRLNHDAGRVLITSSYSILYLCKSLRGSQRKPCDFGVT